MDYAPTAPPATFVLGGARSGKSAYAEELLAAYPHPVYIATAEARDAEMAERIAGHRARRGDRWRTVEAPHDLAAALAGVAAGPGRAALVDCLTLWLANRMEAGADLAADQAGLLDRLRRMTVPTVLVANEVGLGIVPDNALARRFRDAAGRLNQAVAALCPRVVLMTAGLPLALKTAPAPALEQTGA